MVLGQNAFDSWVVALDGDHGVVHSLTDAGLFGVGLEVGPAGIGGHAEDVVGLVFVRVFASGPGIVPFPSEDLGAVFLEVAREVLQEDPVEDDVVVLLSAAALRLRRVDVVAPVDSGCLRCAPAVSGEPRLGLEANGVGGVFLSRRLGAGGHEGRWSIAILSEML